MSLMLADGTVLRHGHASDHPWRPRKARVAAPAAAPDTSPADDPAVDTDDGALHYGHGPAGAHAPGLSQGQMVRIEQDILGKNDGLAAGKGVTRKDREV